MLQHLGYLVRNVAPVFLLCDPRDIEVASRLKDTYFDCPGLYVYDSYPGGTGLSEGFLRNILEILKGSLELVESCPCSQGCPSCIGPGDAERSGSANPKEAVLAFLNSWLKGL